MLWGVCDCNPGSAIYSAGGIDGWRSRMKRNWIWNCIRIEMSNYIPGKDIWDGMGWERLGSALNGKE